MTKVNFITDFDNPCPKCEGVRRYRINQRCVRCTRQNAAKKVLDKVAAGINLDSRWDKNASHSKAMESAVMKRVKFENVTGVYD